MKPSTVVGVSRETVRIDAGDKSLSPDTKPAKPEAVAEATPAASG